MLYHDIESSFFVINLFKKKNMAKFYIVQKIFKACVSTMSPCCFLKMHVIKKMSSVLSDQRA